MSVSKAETTRLLANFAHGDPIAVERLTPLLYDELRAIAKRIFRRENSDHTLQATALVHEAFLRLVDQDGVDAMNRAQFLALGATIMRRILIDHAKASHRLKRGGDRKPVTLHETSALIDEPELEVLDLDEALRELEALDERQARIVELRFFGGATVEETALALGVSERSISDDWRMARAWLKRKLDPQRKNPPM